MPRFRSQSNTTPGAVLQFRQISTKLCVTFFAEWATRQPNHPCQSLEKTQFCNIKKSTSTSHGRGQAQKDAVKPPPCPVNWTRRGGDSVQRSKGARQQSREQGRRGERKERVGLQEEQGVVTEATEALRRTHGRRRSTANTPGPRFLHNIIIITLRLAARWLAWLVMGCDSSCKSPRLIPALPRRLRALHRSPSLSPCPAPAARRPHARGQPARVSHLPRARAPSCPLLQGSAQSHLPPGE